MTALRAGEIPTVGRLGRTPIGHDEDHSAVLDVVARQTTVDPTGRDRYPRQAPTGPTISVYYCPRLALPAPARPLRPAHPKQGFT
jgi:hypothetical protein